MEGDIYEISPRSGRLRKRVKYKKNNPKKSFTSKLSNFIQHPIFIFTIVAITGTILYFMLEEPAKKSRHKPAPASVGINKKINDNKTVDN